MSPESGDPCAAADVCLVLEGTYPYTRGGVSTWAHDLIRSLPHVKFALAHVAAEPGIHAVRRYELPANVVGLVDIFCRRPREDAADPVALRRAARAALDRHADPRRHARVLAGLRRLHLQEAVDETLLDDLAAGDLSVEGLLHGRPAFDLMIELCERLAPESSLLHFFWHFRSMHLPLVRLLRTPPPGAAVYHAVCTGYAGFLAAAWSRRTGKPLLLTEHGIYTRERDMDLSRSPWFRDATEGETSEDEESVPARGAGIDTATAAALRRMWGRHFRALARCAYAQASSIVSLSDVSRARQIADGAPAGKSLIVPNGVDGERLEAMVSRFPPRARTRDLPRVGFVGRLVP